MIAWLANLNKQPLALPFLISSTSRPLFEVIITKHEGILSTLILSLGSLDIKKFSLLKTWPLSYVQFAAKSCVKGADER